ncbi:LysM peptidoglycan-binding domain-containing protein [Aliivibrio logei]|uniref:LysM peptidoglycan-binding domain-containing protein n=1 Tax=Aliivibrio logei TaxID=688 RepID=UPI0035C8815C
MMRLKMKAWDEKVGDFVDLDALGKEITKPKPQPKYRNAFYKPVEGGFLTPEQKAQQEQPHNEPVVEKNAPVATYEYNIEIACAQEDIVTYQIGAFSLGKTGNEPLISSWQKSASQTGFTLLTASVMVNEPKALYREFFQSSGSALAFQDVNPVKKGSGTHTESFVPIKTAVQVGEQLGWPTTGFYYHFIDDKLTHEYQIVGNDASTFFATQSSAEQLSSSLLSDHQYNFILLPWKVNNAPVTRQHLLYLPQKMTQEEFAELNATWLDENACLLDVENIVKSKNENALVREKTEGDEVTYVIQPNDSLSKIAHQQGTTLESLVELNPQYKGKEGQIQIGDTLIIESNKDESTQIPAHIVVLNGDGNRETWDEIAKQHCMAPKELLTLNSMFEDNPSALKVGDELCINAPQQAQDKAQRVTLPPIVLTHIGQVSSFVNSFSSMSKRLLNAFVVAALSDKNIPANTPIVNVGKKTLRSTELSASNDLELLANEKGEVIKKKAESESVKAIQKALLKLNFDLGSAGADGKFGAGTESVIKTFQSTYTPTNKIHADYKIGSADGIVGKNTLLALDEAVVGQWVYSTNVQLVTFEQLKSIMGGLEDERVNLFLAPINTTLRTFSINTPLRIAYFLSQIAHETGNLRYMEEIGSGEIYENRTDLGNTQKGDGARFKGRGLLQLTGRDNYTKCQSYLTQLDDYKTLDITSSTALASQVSENIELACLVSGYYWRYIKPKLNQSADRDDVFWVSVYINGWAVQSNPVYPDRKREPNHMQDRINKLKNAKKVLEI